MYETTKEIDVRFKIFKFIHFQEFIILLLVGLALYVRVKTLNIYLKFPYFFLGMGFAVYLIKNSSGNIGKKNIHSIFYSLIRTKSTVKSIENDFSIINDIKYNQKRKKLKIKKSTLDYIDFCYINSEGYIKHKEKNQYCEILQIETIDLSNLNTNHINTIIQENADFYKKFISDIKIISMNFPCDFKEQIKYFEKKLDTVSNDFRKKFLKLKIQELEYLQATKYNLEFYLVVFVEGEKNIHSDIEMLISSFPNNLIKIPIEKKEKILFKLNNMNTEI